MAANDTITEKTKLPLGLVLTLFTIAAAGVGSFLVTQNEMGHLKDDTTHLRQEVATLRAEQRESDRRIQRNEDNYPHILEVLVELKQDVKELKDRRGK